MKKKLLITLITLLPVISFAQWQWLNPLPQGDGISDLFFVDGTTGFAATYSGLIMKSTDAGTSWKPQAKPTSNSLTAIHFVNSTLGFACGTNGTLVKTTDGGNTEPGSIT